MRLLWVPALVGVLGFSQAPKPSNVTIDHIILGVSDLDTGIAEFEQKTGVRPVFGGVHPGRGTRNALASLGDTSYIEVLAPDPQQTGERPMVTELKGLARLRPVGWALGVTEVFELQARLQQREIRHGAAIPGSRALPDGSQLQWSSFSVTQPAHAWMPFFIKWSDANRQPARTSPRGCSLVSVQLSDPNPDPLTFVLRAVGVDVAIQKGESRMSVALDCPTGRVTF